MPYRNYRNFGQKPRRYSTRRVSRKTQRTKRLVDGTSVYTKAERMLRAGASTTQTVAALARNVGTIMSMINTELKYVDSSQVQTQIDSLATFTNFWLTSIGQGDDDSQRNGNQILLKDMTLKYNFSMNGNTLPTIIRLILFIDKECDGAVPLLTQLLEDVGNIHSPINKDYSKRFTILKNAEYDLSVQNPIIHDKAYIKLPFHTFYDAASTAITSAKENQVFCFIISEYNDIPPNLPIVNLYSRVNYYDN